MIDDRQEMVAELTPLILNCKLSPALDYVAFYKEIEPRIELMKQHNSELNASDVTAITDALFVHYALATISYDEKLTLVVAYMIKRLGHIIGLTKEEIGLIKPFVALVLNSTNQDAILDTLFDAYQIYNRKAMEAIAKARGVKL